ncbi:hypothetical protein MERGE_001940 [Pneumocystis wakefieldiae]|uniref:Uncharacterized protein n=1 Tax=Pneumocystis wakefieldiae TaxID=38082 RepID=A0A899FZU8_9ASCO|nr:hypothetical protein MERGE_001940 [Pneumocystis wakefieldiae]
MRRFNLGFADIVHRSLVVFLSGLTVYGTLNIGYLLYKRKKKLKTIEDQIRQGLLPPTPVKKSTSHDKQVSDTSTEKVLILEVFLRKVRNTKTLI